MIRWRRHGGNWPPPHVRSPMPRNCQHQAKARLWQLGPDMSQPRSIVSGATYLLTRRTLRRHLLLRPDAAITQLIVYALAVSASRYGLQVHAICAMSTHIHLVVTDSKGVLPRFLHHFHRLIALGTKILRSWEGPVWDHEPTSVVRLMTRASVVEKIAYTLANLLLPASCDSRMNGLGRRCWPPRSAVPSCVQSGPMSISIPPTAHGRRWRRSRSHARRTSRKKTPKSSVAQSQSSSSDRRKQLARRCNAAVSPSWEPDARSKFLHTSAQVALKPCKMSIQRLPLDAKIRMLCIAQPRLCAGFGWHIVVRSSNGVLVCEALCFRRGRGGCTCCTPPMSRARPCRRCS